MRAYFENGTVPEEGTVCEEDCGEFELCAEAEKMTAPIPVLGRGALPGMGELDSERLEGLSAALMQEWS